MTDAHATTPRRWRGLTREDVWTATGCLAAAAITIALAGRLAEVIQQYAFSDPQAVAWISGFSGAARVGDSRWLRPEWASRPVSIELWFLFRTVVERVLGALRPEEPTAHIKRLTATLWFVLALTAVPGAATVFIRAQLPADRRASFRRFLLALLITDIVAYFYYFYAQYFTAMPYDLVAAALNFVSLALVFETLQTRSRSLLVLACLWCVVATFVKETVLVIYGAAALIALLRRSARPHGTGVAAAFVLAVAAARFLQTAYGKVVIRADEWTGLQPTGSFLGSIVAMSQMNAGILFGTRWTGQEFHYPLPFILPLLFAATPWFRTPLPAWKEDIIRLSTLLFLVLSLTGGVILELRLLLEFVLLVVLTAALSALPGAAPRAEPAVTAPAFSA